MESYAYIDPIAGEYPDSGRAVRVIYALLPGSDQPTLMLTTGALAFPRLETLSVRSQLSHSDRVQAGPHRLNTAARSPGCYHAHLRCAARRSTEAHFPCGPLAAAIRPVGTMNYPEGPARLLRSA